MSGLKYSRLKLEQALKKYAKIYSIYHKVAYFAKKKKILETKILKSLIGIFEIENIDISD